MITRTEDGKYFQQEIIEVTVVNNIIMMNLYARETVATTQIE